MKLSWLVGSFGDGFFADTAEAERCGEERLVPGITGEEKLISDMNMQ